MVSPINTAAAAGAVNEVPVGEIDNRPVIVENAANAAEIPPGAWAKFSNKLKSLVDKVIDFVKEHWGLVALMCAATAVCAVFAPVVVITAVSLGLVGFAVGFATTPIESFGGSDKPYWEKIQENTDPALKTMLLAGSIILAPITPLVGSFLLGNWAYHKV